VIVGAINRDGFVGLKGYARLYSGATGALLGGFVGPAAGDSFGIAVCGVGDVDLDGTPDVAVGRTEVWIGGKGVAQVFSGVDGTPLYGLEGLGTFDQFGAAVEAAGDFNADGSPDLLVGAPEFLSPTIGYAIVISSAHALAYGPPLLQLSDPLLPASGALALVTAGTQINSTFGSAAAMLGDVNGDAISDLVVGAPFQITAETGTGRATVVNGADGTPIRSHDGAAQSDQYGCALAAAGDLDGDGIGDYLIGAKQSLGWTFYPEVGTGSGYAQARSGADGSLIYALPGPAFESLYGRAVHGGGDVDGDGRPDFLITAPFDSMMEGSVALYSSAAALAPYGAGCPGSAGFVPELELACVSAPGGKLTLEVSGALGTSTAFVLVGSAPGDIPLAGGCSLLVLPAPPEPQAALALAGAGPGAGVGSLEALLPLDVVSGSTLSFQAFVLDPGCAAGFCATNGVLLTLP
jgi:hypothetical protein